MEKKITKAELWFGARFNDLSAEQKILYQRKVSAECYERKKEAKKQRAVAEVKANQMEELIAQVRELQAQLEELKNPKTTYGDLVVGDTFEFKGHEFTKLRDGRAIINDYDEKFIRCIFDNVDNNYKDSLIRHYIHSDKYLCTLDLVDSDFDCDGDTACCELLSKEEYEENRDLMKDFECAWWLRSGNSFHSKSAYYVLVTSGYVASYDVTNLGGVRPAFNFADGIKVQVVNG